MRRTLRWLFAGVLGVGIAASCAFAPKAIADPPTIQNSSNLQAAGTANSCVVSTTSSGSCIVVRCPSGQSTAVIDIPTGVTGVVTAYTAADRNGVAGNYGTPSASWAPGATANSQTISSFPGKLYVSLGSDQWVEAVLTTATSGNATGTISCSGSVARGGAAAAGGTVNTGLNPIVVSGANASCPGCQYPVYNPEQSVYGSCVFDGTTPLSTCFQSLLTLIGLAGGGTVNMPLKHGYFDAGVTVPANVSIYCPKQGPVNGYHGGATPPPGAACLAQIYDASNPAFYLSGGKSTVANMTFVYPVQATTGPTSSPLPSLTPYPPTIQSTTGPAGDRITGNTFLNSYDAIKIQGPAIVDHNNIGAFHYGISELNVHDYSDIHDNQFEPYWDNVTGVGSNCGSGVDQYVVNNGSWMVMSDADGPSIQGIQGFCGGNGLLLTDDGTDASYGELFNAQFQSVTAGIYAQSTHSGPGWQLYGVQVGTLTGGHPIVFATPVATSPPQITSASISWYGGVAWNTSSAVLDNDPNADFQIIGVPGLTGTLSQVGTGQGQSNVAAAQIWPAREFTSATISTIGSCWLCYGATNTASLAVFSMGNANGVGHFTAAAASNAHTVQTCTDTVIGWHDAATYYEAVDSGDNACFLNNLTAGQFLDAGVPTGNWVGATTNGQFTAEPSPSPQATATACGAAATRTGNFPTETYKLPVCATTPPALFATTGQASPAPTGTPYLQVPCGTGAVGCTGAGDIAVTTGVNNTGNGEWLGTLIMTMTSPVSAGETANGCISGVPALTLLDAMRFNSAAACAYSAPSGTAASGSQPFANGTGSTNSGNNVTIVSHFTLANSTSQTFRCWVGTSTATAMTIQVSCSALLQPY